jgi:hypothetical protein
MNISMGKQTARMSVFSTIIADYPGIFTKEGIPMKKYALILTIFILTALLLAGCNPQFSPTPGPGGPQGGQTQIINPGGPQPGGPQPADQPKGPGNPQPPTPEGKPGGGEGPAGGDPGGGYVDLALSDIYLDGAEVLFSIRNVGTAALPDQSVAVACRGDYADGGGRTELLPSEVEILPGTLTEPGSGAEIGTGYSLDPKMTSLSVECSINPNPWDANPVNDRLGPVKIK